MSIVLTKPLYNSPQYIQHLLKKLLKKIAPFLIFFSPTNNQNKIKKQLMDDSELNQHQSHEDLSITLLERRKRLHVLATEINNWEDEEHKK